MIKRLRIVVSILAFIVFAICFYTFLLGNGIFEGKFENDGFSWYFLAKGIFCSTTLYLLSLILERLCSKKK